LATCRSYRANDLIDDAAIGIEAVQVQTGIMDGDEGAALCQTQRVGASETATSTGD
jgi:hypothetical protein